MPHSNNILRISYNTIPDKPKSNIDKAIETIATTNWFL